MLQQRQELNDLEAALSTEHQAIQQLKLALGEVNTTAAQLQSEKSVERANDRVNRHVHGHQELVVTAHSNATAADPLSNTIFESLAHSHEKLAWALLVRETRRAVAAVLHPDEHATTVRKLLSALHESIHHQRERCDLLSLSLQVSEYVAVLYLY